MKKILIVGDTHIDEKSISEIDAIFEKDILPIEAETLIQVGDYYHSNFPSAAELKFGTALAKKLVNRYKEVIILSGTGEHDLCRGSSVIEYLSEVGVDTVKGDLKYNNLLFGHFMLNESKLAFGTGKCGLKDVAQYEKVFLGHQHIPEFIKPNVYHIGSVRYVSFGEVGYPKRILLLEDKELTQIELTATIPMVDVNKLDDLTNILDRTKVRLTYTDFNVYKKEAAEANRQLKRFTQGKIKLDFAVNNTLISAKTEVINQDQLIRNYLDKIEDKEVRKLIEDNLC